MKKLISGLTIIKHGISQGYAFKESIKSIEPICDEIIINIGFDDPNLKKDDGTYEFLRDYLKHPKFKFLKSYWDPKMRKDGLILSEQTNIALNACEGQFAQYIQSDEALHENDLSCIQDQVLNIKDQNEIEGLVFHYHHFYASPNIVKYTRNVYRREVRLIRNNGKIRSVKDAQGFRHISGRKIMTNMCDAYVYHYGYARPLELMKIKARNFDKLYHGEGHEQKEEFSYRPIYGLKKFKGSHPSVMKEWLLELDSFDDLLLKRPEFEWKNIGLMISDKIENLTNYRIGEYKNFKLV